MLVIPVSVPPEELGQVRWKQLLGRTKLALELPLRPHPRVLNVVGVDSGVVRIKEVFSMYDHIVQVDAQSFSYTILEDYRNYSTQPDFGIVRDLPL